RVAIGIGSVHPVSLVTPHARGAARFVGAVHPIETELAPSARDIDTAVGPVLVGAGEADLGDDGHLGRPVERSGEPGDRTIAIVPVHHVLVEAVVGNDLTVLGPEDHLIRETTARLGATWAREDALILHVRHQGIDPDTITPPGKDRATQEGG